MKLLVTGASGFLGRNVIEAARQRNWDVVGLYWKSKTFLDFATKAGCQAVRAFTVDRYARVFVGSRL